jgi:hypothetical protein
VLDVSDEFGIIVSRDKILVCSLFLHACRASSCAVSMLETDGRQEREGLNLKHAGEGELQAMKGYSKALSVPTNLGKHQHLKHHFFMD